MIKDFINAKKAQLGAIEAKFWIYGFVIGILLTLLIVYLANKGILIPFKLRFLCPVVPVP